MSSDEEKTLRALPARPLLQLLEDLARIREARATGEERALPLATFHLRSGRDICGWLVSATLGRNGERSLLVQRYEPGRGPCVAAIYLDASALEAITLDAPAAFAPYLSGGTVAPPIATLPPGEGVTRLQLRRTLKELSDALGAARGTPLELTAAWDDLPTEPGLLAPLASLAADLVEVLTAIGASPLGQAALAPIQQIVLARGARGVGRDGPVVSVRSQLELGRQGRIARSELQAELEKVL